MPIEYDLKIETNMDNYKCTGMIVFDEHSV